MPDLAPGTRVAERYAIEAEIGAGGMGVVFRARDERLGREVALKVLAADAVGDAGARKRLLREARAGAAIDHPSLARVYDVGETDDGSVFLVMELVRGRSLRELVREGPRPREEVARLVTELARALAAVHAAGVVHRDVKPDNVIVRDDGRVVLLDLGLAKVAPLLDVTRSASGAPLTTERGLLGTPSYMAPEQALGGSVDARADAFALGVTAYELLTGRVPWSGTQAFEILAELINWHPLPPSARTPGLGPRVDAVIARAIAKKPEERYADVEELAAALSGALSEPEPARTASTEPSEDVISAGDVLAGRFRVTALRREDATCRQHDAEDLVRAEPITIDCLRLEVSSISVVRDRFEHDMTLLRGIEHPGLARVRALGRHRVAHGELVFAARDRAAPETLADALARAPALPIAEAERIARDLLAALEAAHEGGLVHGALAPRHVGLDPDGRVVLSGFGSGVSDEASGALRASTLEGVAYLAPEQVRGAAITTRSDLYALGVMLFELVTGRLPFVGATPISIAAKRLLDPPPVPSALATSLDARWDRAILRCLERNPEDRFAHARDVLAALDAAAQDASPYIPPSASRSFDSAPNAPSSPPRPSARRVAVRAALAMLALVGAGLGVFALAQGGDARLPLGTPRQLTSGPAWEAEPALSPDGNLVAYASDEQGNADIWLVDARGGTPLRLTDDVAQDRSPSWFPDGSALAFASDRGGTWGIWKVARLGGSATPIAADAIDPAISPDGRRVAFVRTLSNGEMAIFVAPLGDATQARRLTSSADGLWEVRRPAWSPDGAEIIYEDFANLWRVRLDGGQATKLTSGNTNDSRPAWSSRGGHVFFSSFRSGTTAIWRLGLDAGELERLTLGTGPEVEPHVAGDGSRLTYSTHAEQTVLVLVDLVSGERSRVSSYGDAFDLALAPDGSAAALVLQRAGTIDLWLQELEGLTPKGDLRRLTELPGTLARPSFSPDGRWLAFHRVVDGERDVWVVPTGGGLPSRVTDAPGNDTMPAWSPDGAAIAFISDRTGSDEIWIQSWSAGSAQGAARQLTFDKAIKGHPVWSRDGRRVAYVVDSDRESDVWTVDAGGEGAPVRVTRGAGARSVRWDHRTGGLVVSGDWGQGRLGVRRVSPDDGSATPLGIELGEPANGAIELSFDGRRFATVVVERRGDVWLLDAPPGEAY